MSVIVQKFGGTSVGDVERIRNVARRVVATREAGHQVAVIVSAMSGETNQLVALAEEVGGPERSPREFDVLVSTGEQKTIALLAMAIHRLGHDAVSFTGVQMGMRTDADHGRARIEAIDADRIRKVLDSGAVAVIAGFQGVDADANITTLGRGGSDTSAVAVACALEADGCEIYTDVDGVFTADPNMVAGARKLDRISYDEMLELASLGSKVLQIRSVKFAMQYGTPIHVRSSFHDGEGTWVLPEEDVMERLVVSGVTYNRGEAKIRVAGVKDTPGSAGALFGPLSEAGIVVDMIVQNVVERRHDRHDLHGAEERLRARPGVDAGAGSDAGRRLHRGRPGYREGVGRGSRHEGPRRCRGEDVQRARGRGHQHPDDQHQRDQDLGRHPGEVHGARGACAPQGVHRRRRCRAPRRGLRPTGRRSPRSRGRRPCPHAPTARRPCSWPPSGHTRPSISSAPRRACRHRLSLPAKAWNVSSGAIGWIPTSRLGVR